MLWINNLKLITYRLGPEMLILILILHIILYKKQSRSKIVLLKNVSIISKINNERTQCSIIKNVCMKMS